MSITTLTAISPIDGRYEKKVDALQAYLSEFALIKYRLFVEISWFIALSECDSITELPALAQTEKTTLMDLFEHFSEDDAEQIKRIESKTNHDVKAVEYFLKEKFEASPQLKPYVEFIHFACTSEDINNLAYALMLKNAREKVMLPLMHEIINKLRTFGHAYADTPMLARTHGQPASPTTVGKEIINVVYRLERQLNLFEHSPLRGKINGAVGNFNAHLVSYPHIHWHELTEKFVTDFGLSWNEYTTQIESHDYIAELFDHIVRFNTVLIDFSRDTWGYISLNYFKQKSVAEEVGSSTMPHKVNPIDFENAEGNLEFANNTMSFLGKKIMTSRWQRDLVDSTLLRNLGVGFAHSLVAYHSLLKGISKLEVNHDILTNDLNEHWEILGEAVQTVMRRYGIEKPYEQLKTLTRGKKLTQKVLHQFIETLSIPQEAKERLLELTPSNYIGIAASLAKK